jgi:ATP-dependent DNA helicase RecG
VAQNKLPNLIDSNQMKRTTGVNLPLIPIREGLVNALIHRDYDIEGGKVQLKVTPDGFSIISPGKPTAPITVEKMASFTAPTLSRNPKLHYVFKQMDLAEERNRGMKALRELRDSGDLVPTITFVDPYLTLTLHASLESAANEIAQTNVADQLSPDELKGWGFLRRREVVSTSDYVADQGVSESTARRHLNKLVSLGLARRDGRGPATRYTLSRPGDEAKNPVTRRDS